MARGVNKVILIGNLGKDPELRALPSGQSVANFSVATSESWKDKESGEAKEKTEWHNVAIFGRLAEIASEYLKKGSKVYLEGSLRTRKWQDKQGNDRYTTEVVATEMQMLDAARTGSGPREERQAPQQRSSRPARQPEPDGGEFDDDIPF